MSLTCCWNQMFSVRLDAILFHCHSVWVQVWFYLKRICLCNGSGEDAFRMLTINRSSKLTSISILILSTLLSLFLFLRSCGLTESLGFGWFGCNKNQHFAIFMLRFFNFTFEHKVPAKTRTNSTMNCNRTLTTTLNTHCAQMSEALFVRQLVCVYVCVWNKEFK